MEKMLRDKKNIALMMLPILVVYVLFVPVPAVTSFAMSLTDWKGLGTPSFVGLENYIKMFTKDRVFIIAFKNTMKWMAAGLVMQLVTAFLLALLINSKIKGRSFFRSIMFMPTTFSAVAVSLIWYFVYHPEIGMINQFIRSIGFEEFNYAWLRDSRFALYGVLISVTWQWAGYYVVIFLSGLVGIPKELEEAAKIDGANYIKVVQHIYMPYLKPIFRVVLVLSITSSFKGFGPVFVMTQGGPNNATMLLGLRMYLKGFGALEYGYGCAAAVVITLLCVSATVIVNTLFRKDSIEG